MGRFIIYGAGAIGGAVGGHLARSGADVVLVARQAHVNAINQSGLRLITPLGTFNLPIPAVTGVDQIEFRPDDMVFMCMKGQDSEESLRSLKARVQDIPVFCFQNGVRNEETASQFYDRVYGVMVHIGATYLTPGEVRVHRDPPGTTVMGRYPKGSDDIVKTAAKALKAAGFRTLVTDDVVPYKWGKLMGNLANSIVAATDGKDPNGRIAGAVRGEARTLMQEAGIRWTTIEDARKQFPDLATPDRASLEQEGHGSTWQSLKRGEGTVETELLNGEIVRLAARLGKTAPLNAGLVRVAQEMAQRGDKPGLYTQAELAKAIGMTDF